MEVFRTAGEVPNGLNVLLLEYKCIWPSFPPLMYLMRHNESLGSMMDRGSDTRQRENKMHVADGKKMSKVTAKMLLKVKCFRDIPPIQQG